MNHYLTQAQEDNIYQEVICIFENKESQVTNCESNYIFDEYNYFTIHTRNNSFTVDFKTNNGKLLKRSILIKQL